RWPGRHSNRGETRLRRIAGRALLLAMLVPIAAAAQTREGGGVAAEPQKRLFVEIMAAAKLPGSDAIVFAGNFGLLGLLEPSDQSDVLLARTLPSGVEEDFISVTALEDGSALIGSGSGRVYRFQDGAIGGGVDLGESPVPVLDLEAQRGEAWAVGGRGLVVRSTDGGASWSPVDLGA